MLSNSPDRPTTASPPGPPSSQSSSVGSCYTSDSSRASFQARPTLSDPSSSSTSLASACDRTVALTKRTAQTIITSPILITHHGAIEHHPEELFPGKTSHSGLASRASPLADYSRTRTMQPLASDSSGTGHLDVFRHAGSSNNITFDPSPHATREAQHFDSPDNHAPAPKARRTSPGGSRTSGNFDPLHNAAPTDHSANSHPLAGASAYAHISSDASPFMPSTSSSNTTQETGSSTGVSWNSTVASDKPPDSVPGPQPRWPSSDALRSHVTQTLHASTTPSPRTQDSGTVSVPHDSHAAISKKSASPQASSVSLTDRSEGAIRSKHPTLPKMDLAAFSPQELLKILAMLLHEIATANDEFQPDGGKEESSRSRRAGRSRDRSAPPTPVGSSEANDASAVRGYAAPPGSHLSFSDSRRPSVTTAALGALATPSSTLCFHARNVPSISIESYLLRILKYCPTTNEVFLSLLVYFDRMSRMGTGAKPGANGEGEVAGEAAGLPRAIERATGQQDLGLEMSTRQSDGSSTKDEPSYTHPGIRGFAIDSYNVHRLVIAGVTVASKFFSDVFYTNSRYAKVGGLPPHELNQLELQFLLLNDFRLTIPLEEMQRYADQLLMYASGRPEMAKITKTVSSSVTSSSSTSSANVTCDTDSAVPAAANSERTTAVTTVIPSEVHENEGDVQMSDA